MSSMSILLQALHASLSALTCFKGFDVYIIALKPSFLEVGWSDSDHHECCGSGGVTVFREEEDGVLTVDDSDETFSTVEEAISYLKEGIEETDCRDDEDYHGYWEEEEGDEWDDEDEWEDEDEDEDEE